ncbi:type I restriction-modification system subunit M [Micromonospora saelicesensis]|uniref:site-specific DNA-methyltransferase (adenine-specific) n=1 Tax=Micromonospora saelicesensis TaxID=285676 RepID=A0A1C4WEY7_9ACTN|nr:class I SAM-dependent DNA methyltransferase [Micromonospora saelicesensis]SCE94807.1 type I restriction enzyme M protein [Micromonospora saelicesensis]
MSTHQSLAGFIWSVADLLRGDYKQSEYGKVILPLTVLRRLDCVMAPTRKAVWDRDASLKLTNKDQLLRLAAGLPFYNTSKQSFETIGASAPDVAKNLTDYINGFSPNAREIVDKYEFHTQIARLQSAKLLYPVVQKFRDIDLSLERVDNHQMGYVFEELIRRFADASNETAGEHFTPREVIKLMVNLLIGPDSGHLTGAPVINVLDPACGTGGMLSAAEEVITSLNPRATVRLFGQELNAESYAICRSDMMLKGQDPSNIHLGNSFSDDGHEGQRFDYLLANPPFGVEWKKVKDEVDAEATLGHAGRFGAGLPRINDGSFLFLQHMISKMEPPEKGGSRIAIVFNGSPLFTGAAESGESNIRRWILENDLLEGVVGLPDQLFYNTGISTYFWILSNRKAENLKRKVILLDARDQWIKMRKSLGDKRKMISGEQVANITRLYGQALSIAEDEAHPDQGKVKVFQTTDFGYQRIAVERPLKLRFEITEETLAALAESKPLFRYAHRDELIGAFKPLLGTVWRTKAEAKDALHAAAVAGGVLWPTGATAKAIMDTISLSDPDGEVQKVKGEVVPDSDLRDYENVPLVEDVHEYFEREVRPHVPEAWIDESKTKIGYEIPFTRHFFVYKPPRPLAEIDAELRELESQIQALLSEVTS